ncbi:MAG TPA: response regulator [Candidatus Ozemobacteraceae bacterium]|nr:response regulator [Candidatus Ozemobacteraceae bacterium]
MTDNPASILLVDDVVDNLQVLSDILMREGFRVRAVTSGAMALKTVESAVPDLFLLDIKMPQMDGYELCRRLKADEKMRDIPVIFVSAMGETTDKVRGFEVGAVDFVTKPFQASEIVARVRTHLTLVTMRRTLHDLNQHLEQRVEERTRELAQTNLRLAQEVAERRQAEADRDRKTEEINQLFNMSIDLLCIADVEGRFVRLNSTWEKTLGYTLSELEGKRYIEFVHPDDVAATLEAMAQLAAGKPIIDFSNRYRCRDGSFRLIEWRSKPYQNTFVYAAARDITERNQMQEALKKSEQQLQQMQKMEAIGQLAGGIAHDFNNQLGGIIGFVDLLQLDLEKPEHRTYCNKILEITKRAADLTSKLLAFARKGKFLSAPVDIHALVPQIVEILQRSIDKRISIRQELSSPVSVTLGDQTQLQNALLNLAINARDAMPNGGELSFATALVDLNERAAQMGIAPGRYLEIRVSDTGSGMSPETQKHVFEPFFTTKPAGHGTGLGLASVFGTVKNHRGGILFYSELGHGTSFKIYLPVSSKEVQPEAEKHSEPIKGNARILIVDDEEGIRESLALILQKLGHTVTSCCDGEEALSLYASRWQQFDLVILDMIMPRMSGGDVFEKMHAINPQVCVLLSSGYSLNGQAQSILDRGVKGFLHKPFQANELSQVIARVLDH